MTKSITLSGVALVALIGTTSMAAAEICVSEEAVNEARQEAMNEQANSPAHARFEIHFASLSAETGSRIESEGINMARPVQVVSAEEFKLDWRR